MRIRAIILEGEADETTLAVLREAMAAPELSIVFAAPTVAAIAARVSYETGVTIGELGGYALCQRVSRVRDAAVLLARRLSGRALGGRDHSTIVGALRRAERREASDPAFRLLVARVTAHFEQETRS